jgi:hypothetical protein
MASSTQVYKTRKKLKKRKAGRKRKNEIARKGSTPSRAAFFGDQEK